MVLQLFTKLPIAAQAALVSTAFISFVPNIIFLLLPSYKTGEGMTSKVLSIGQAMAAGSLLGDVFLHTFEDANNNPNAGISILTGYVLFLIADITLRSLNQSSSNKSSHQHHNSNNPTTTKAEPTKTTVHQSTIYLNLAADSLHNFTDGLAIGASYATVVATTGSTTTTGAPDSCCSDTLYKMIFNRNGLIATVAILLHEIPHELGDFCTLVKAGYSKADAVKAQFGTAVAAFAGTITALFIVSNSNTAIQEQLVFITAGGFIYLAATTLVPEVLGNHHNHDHGSSSNNHETTTVSFRLTQLIAFLSGIGFLYLVSVLEDSDTSDHGHHHHHHHHDHIQHDHHNDHQHDHDHDHSEL